MRSEDLTTLFEGPSVLPLPPAPTVRQGTILTFDAVTGANTVQIGSEVMVDLPVDAVGAVPLSPNDVVQIDTSTPSWFIKGRVSDPGTGAVPTWPADIEQAQSSANQASADAAAAQAAAAALQLELDAAEAAVAAVEASLLTLNGTTLPALQAALDAAEADVAAATASLATLTGTTLPAMAADVAAVEADITTLTGTTIPALQTEVDGILPITETDISDDAITTPKIAANAVVAGKIAADAVTAVKILAGAVTTAKLDAGAVTAVKIAANTITAAEIAADAITASELAANAVTAGKIAAATIVAADISAGAITTPKIAADAVTSNEIAAGTITATEIAAGAITGAKLTADAIDGKTITGATFLTAGGTSAHWELSSTNSNKLLGYPATNVNSPQPGSVFVDSTSIGASGWMYETKLTAPYSTLSGGSASNPYLRIVSHEGTGRTSAEAIADQGAFASPARTLGMFWDADVGELILNAPAGVKANGVEVATTTGTQTLTNKRIDGLVVGSGGTAVNVLKFANLVATPNASGQIVVTHGLGAVPGAVVLGVQTQDRIVRVQGSTSTTFTLECRVSGTGVVVTTSMAIYWLAVR